MKVADVFAELHLDTSGFDREIRAALAKAPGGRDIKMKIDVDTKSIDRAGRSVSGLDKSVKNATSGINTYTGRISLMADAILSLSPAAAAVGAVAVPAVTALGQSFVVAGAGAGTAVLAFQGVGDALKAMTEVGVEPSAANLEKLNEAMSNLSPEAQSFTRYLYSMNGALKDLRSAAGQELFPGLQTGLEAASRRLPEVNSLLVQFGSTLGSIAARSGEALASDRWDVLFNVIRNGRPQLDTMATSLGNVAHGAVALLDAFAPLSAGGLDWVADITGDFDRWATSLKGTDGFKEFGDYVRDVGPQLAETVGAISLALVDIGKAAAPMSGPVLSAITAIAKALSAVANSSVGPALVAAAIGMRLISRAAPAMTAVTTAVAGLNNAVLDLRTSPNQAATAMGILKNSARGLAGSAGLIGLATAASSSNDAVKVLGSTASAAAIGFSVGGPWGAAIGGAVGLLGSLASAQGDAAASTRATTEAFDAQTGAVTDYTRTLAAKDLQEKGAFEQAKALGISYSDLVDYTLGVGDAQTRLNGIFDAHPYDATITSVENLKKSYSDSEVAAILADRAATQLEGTLPGLAGEWAGAAGDAKTMTDAVYGTSDAMSTGANAAKSYTDALKSLDAFLAGRGNLRGYQQALDDFSASLKANGANFDITTKKGRDTQAALDGVASSALAVIENMKPGAKRDSFIKGYIGDLRQFKQDFPGATAEVDKFIKRAKQTLPPITPKIKFNSEAYDSKRRAIDADLGRLGKKVVTPKVDANTKGANSKLSTTKGKADTLDKTDPSVDVTANTGGANSALDTTIGKLSQIVSKSITITANVVGSALGKLKFATGGHVSGPGTGTSDSIPAMLSDGEYVVRSAAVKKVGLGTLDRINSMGRYADGGLVQKFAAGGQAKKAAAATKQRAQNRAEFLFDQRLENLLDAAADGKLGAFDKAIAYIKKAMGKTKKWSDAYVQLRGQLVDVAEQRADAKAALKTNKADYLFDKQFQALADKAAAGDLSAFDKQIKMLQAAMKKTKKWSDEYVALRQQIDGLAASKAEAAKAAREAAAEHAKQIREALADFKLGLTGDFFSEGLASQITPGADFRGIIGGIVEQGKALLEMGAISKTAYGALLQSAQKYTLQLEAVQKQLDANAEAQEKANEQLQTATERLNDAQAAWDGLKSSAKGAITALNTFGESGAAQTLEDAQKTYQATLAKYGQNSANTAEARRRLQAAQVNPGTIVSTLQGNLMKVKSFAANIKKLIALGLNKTAIQEILGMGVVNGAIYAEALANAMPSTISSINSLQSEIDQVGEELGINFAEAFAGDELRNAQMGVDIAKGIIEGLKSQQAALEEQMTSLGEAMVAAFVRLLGIHSPSRVFRDLGMNTLLGLQQGLTAQVPDTVGVIDGLAGRMHQAAQPSGTSSASPAAQARTSGTGTVVINGGVHLTRDVEFDTLTQKLDFWTRQSGRTR